MNFVSTGSKYLARRIYASSLLSSHCIPIILSLGFKILGLLSCKVIKSHLWPCLSCSLSIPSAFFVPKLPTFILLLVLVMWEHYHVVPITIGSSLLCLILSLLCSPPWGDIAHAGSGGKEGDKINLARQQGPGIYSRTPMKSEISHKIWEN